MHLAVARIEKNFKGAILNRFAGNVFKPRQQRLARAESIRLVAGKIEIRPMMYLALTYDHRVVDGQGAVTFLVRVKEALEDPARLVLDV